MRDAEGDDLEAETETAQALIDAYELIVKELVNENKFEESRRKLNQKPIESKQDEDQQMQAYNSTMKHFEYIAKMQGIRVEAEAHTPKAPSGDPWTAPRHTALATTYLALRTPAPTFGGHFMLNNWKLDGKYFENFW